MKSHGMRATSRTEGEGDRSLPFTNIILSSAYPVQYNINSTRIPASFSLPLRRELHPWTQPIGREITKNSHILCPSSDIIGVSSSRLLSSIIVEPATRLRPEQFMISRKHEY